MRLIIQPNYELVSKWAVNYVVSKFLEFNLSPSKPFVCGRPAGSSPIGMYKELI